MLKKLLIVGIGFSALTACDSSMDNRPNSEFKRDLARSNPLSTIAGNPLITNLLVYQNDEFLFDLENTPLSLEVSEDDLISIEAVFENKDQILNVRYFIDGRNLITQKILRKEIPSTFSSLLLSIFGSYRFVVVASTETQEIERSTAWIGNSSFTISEQHPSGLSPQNELVFGEEQ
jgi:hypothetical protein